jgi:hypothetical protein
VLSITAVAIIAFSPVGSASCWESGSGATAVYRDPSVRAEFEDAQLVITGKVMGERRITTADDPEGYAFTIYTVKVLQTFKEPPQPTIHLLSENTTARFWMDTGKTYLLFVSRGVSPDSSGTEQLPDTFVDNCGNSAALPEAARALKTVKGLSKPR